MTGKVFLILALVISQFRFSPSEKFAAAGWISTLGSPARSAIRESAIGITDSAKNLVLGITDGDVSGLDATTSNLFKSLSLTHLTAVSGTNCAILIGVLVAATTALGMGRLARVLFCTVTLIGYLVLVGDQPSVLRAATMAAVMLLASVRGLRVPTIHLLSLAVVGLLVVSPNYATNLGFALSVVATAGVVLLAPRLATHFSRFMPGWLSVSLSVALAAQVCCLPLLIGVQTNPSAGAIPANLLAEPAVAPVTVLGLLGALLALLPLHLGFWLAAPIFWVASIPAGYIIAVATFLNDSLPAFSMPSGILGAAFALGLLLAVTALTARRPRFRRLGWLAGLFVICLLVFGEAGHLPTGSFPGRNWVMVACDVGQGDGTVLRSGNSYAVIDVGKDPRDIDHCLGRLGVSKIALLVLTHFDLDHVGGLAGALRNRTVSRALVTQFPDARPGSQAVSRLLRRSRIPTDAVAEGVAGTLGRGARAFDWLVLSPHPGGADAVSSNEGSVSMFWHKQGLNVFTMADLPAAGQARVLQELPTWWRSEYGQAPSILKLSHHGSADQDPRFLAWVHPVITTISVGSGNPYGHPTARALAWLRQSSLRTLRTDQLGSIAISEASGRLSFSASGAR